jgi:hypothetical protein
MPYAARESDCTRFYNGKDVLPEKHKFCRKHRKQHYTVKSKTLIAMLKHVSHSHNRRQSGDELSIVRDIPTA